ncbi:MAG TPA: class I SAM-dependent methyltransferase [Candidatus Kapabacteria bacterium]|nr:class I SAM-dependent methyltransferase [Candidatus Kapabacteria bacterium]
MAVENVPEDLAPYYSEGYFTGDTQLEGYMDYDHDKAASRDIYRYHLKVMEGLINKKEQWSLFEVGCATGFFMNLAKERGWVTEGIDISDYAVKEAQKKGLNVTTATLETYPPTKTFDCVAMHDVIEHVKDPIDLIKRVHKLLAMGGIFVIATPDAGSVWARLWGQRWHAFVVPQHLFYFTTKNLVTLLKREGFDVVHTDHRGKWFSIPYIFRLLHTWTGVPLFSKIAGWTSKTFLQHQAVPINVGDTLFLIARKVR